MEKISVFVNELCMEIPCGQSAGALRNSVKPMADVLILNGAPCAPETILQAGDHVVLIQRGEIPSREDLESLMVARHTPGVHDVMKRAVVGIAGLGGLGSHVAVSLARMGVGTLIMADFDVVEPSNLNRQQYFVEHIGCYKTDAMVTILEKINPYLKVIPHRVLLNRENIPVIFQSARIVIECFDRAEQKVLLIETVSERLPDALIITASGLAGYGDNNSIQTRKLADSVYVVGDLVSAAAPGRGLMAPRVSITAGQQANLAVSLLMDVEKAVL
ncbi:MAG: sulfur carrier protein ThiS adenylyltransferase ThiF [Desulfobacterales bacterium]|jgi:sulfur carrier protein ThiS adenylyltransferase|nr:sulfur carrier protein ThiS adenylyltransferase ThiF [Desulfobacterales bacterium]